MCQVTGDKAGIGTESFLHQICLEAVAFVLLSFCLQKRKTGNNVNIYEQRKRQTKLFLEYEAGFIFISVKVWVEMKRKCPRYIS